MNRNGPSSVLVAIAGAVAIVVFVAGVAAVVNDDEEVPTAGARIHLDGSAQRMGDDGVDPLSDGDILRPGDEVEVTGGTAVFELAGGGEIEARAGRAAVDDTLLEIGEPVRLLAGDALATGPAGVAVEASGTLVTLRSASGGGAARIRRDLAVTTATYQGTTEVDSAGQRRAVPALRQLGVSSVGRPSSEPDPLHYDPADPWDLRFLGEAIDLTRQLDSLSRSFTAQGQPLTTASDYELLLPRLADEPAFGVSFIDQHRSRAAGDTLVGAAIAVLGGRGSFEERWREVFEFRDDGAAWGLVALDQNVSDESVLDDVTLALELSVRTEPPEVAAPPAAPPTGVDDDDEDDDRTPTGAPSTTSPPPGDAPPPEDEEPPPTILPPVPPLLPPITLPGLPLPLPPPLDGEPTIPDSSGLLDALLQPIEDLLGGLIGPTGLLDAS